MTFSFTILVLKLDLYWSHSPIHHLSKHCYKGKRAWSKELPETSFTLFDHLFYFMLCFPWLWLKQCWRLPLLYIKNESKHPHPPPPAKPSPNMPPVVWYLFGWSLNKDCGSVLLFSMAEPQKKKIRQSSKSQTLVKPEKYVRTNKPTRLLGPPQWSRLK